MLYHYFMISNVIMVNGYLKESCQFNGFQLIITLGQALSMEAPLYPAREAAFITGLHLAKWPLPNPWMSHYQRVQPSHTPIDRSYMTDESIALLVVSKEQE